jgi:1,4-alpha-glucan branching enzyme
MEARHAQTSTAARPLEHKVQSIEFMFHHPQSRWVGVAGTFNNWDPKRTPMRKDSSGNWHTTVTLSPGRHEYRFVADGQWISDPKAKDWVKNSFGSTNSVVSV